MGDFFAMLNAKHLNIENSPISADQLGRLVDLISKKKLGCALIVNSQGRLTGLLTDGDIRRILLRYPDVSVLSTKSVMTVNPKTISGDDMATKALAYMEKYCITSLAVCDEDNVPVGIIHIHDLLKAGVA